MEHELLGGVAALACQIGQCGVLLVDPGPVTRRQRRQRAFGGETVGEVAERRHRQLDTRHLHGLRRLHVGRGNPRGAQRPAGAIRQLPVRGHAVAGCILRRVGVVQVRHALVRIVAGHPARVGPRHERHRAPHVQLGLKGECLVTGALGRRRPFVHKEHRHGASPRRNPVRKARGGHRTGDRVEVQTAGAGDAAPARVARSRKWQPDGLVARRALPPGRCGTPGVRASRVVRALRSVGQALRVQHIIRTAAIRGLLRTVAVVAPPDGHVQLVDALGNQEAQAHRRREEASPGCLALLRGVVAQPRLSGDLRVEVVVRVGVRALLGRRVAWHQEPREIPVGWPHPTRQALVGQGVSRPRTDQVHLQRLAEAGAHVSGLDHLRHVRSGTVTAGENRLAAP